tara:strand:- start:1790 stop:3484 length:1695 start_codon:yes stop_codon:yes gene_type:complete
MNIKIISKIVGITLLVTSYNFPLSAQSSDEYSLFYTVPYFEPRLINPIHGSYYLEGVQANELMYSRLWTWKEDISETSDLVDGITPQTLQTMLVPAMKGSSLWSWKIKIRPDLKWPDGRPLTAEDVKFSFEVYSSDKTRSALKELLEIFREIRVIDDETIQFFVRPEDKRRARYVLPLIQILPKHEVVTNYLLKNSQFSNEPMGSGPFQFVPQKKLKKDDKGKIVFKKNANYHRWGKHSNISSVKIHVDKIVGNVIRKLAKEPREENWSTIDLVLRVPNSHTDFENLSSQGEDHLTFKNYNSNSWYGIALNCEKPFLQNRHIRMALTHALNIQEAIDDNYTVFNKGGVYESIADRISGPFNPLWGAGDGSLEAVEYDLKEAEKKLDKNGVVKKKGGLRYYKGKPVQLKLIYNKGRILQGSPEEYVIESIKRYLFKIGIEVVAVSLPAETFAEKLFSGDFDMAFQYYELSYGGNVAPLFTAGNLQNICRFSDPMLTSYLDGYNKSSGVVKKKYGKKIHQIVYKEAPYIFLYRLDKIMAYRNELETNDNFVPKYFFTHIYEWYFKD